MSDIYLGLAAFYNNQQFVFLQVLFQQHQLCAQLSLIVHILHIVI